jgi:transposase-like protein
MSIYHWHALPASLFDSCQLTSRFPLKLPEARVMFQKWTVSQKYAMMMSLHKEDVMVLISVLCPHCQSDQVIKGGTTKAGKQRYRCQNADCCHYSFVRNPAYNGHLPKVKEQIIDMSLNGSGIRDTARVLPVSPTTVINELKKKSQHSAT